VSRDALPPEPGFARREAHIDKAAPTQQTIGGSRNVGAEASIGKEGLTGEPGFPRA